MLPILLWIAAAGAAASESPVQISGELTGADHQSYKAVPFNVPDGVERITVTLSYDKADRTVVDLGVWDPQRFRGWSGGTRDRFTIGLSDASPGYLPGALPSGRWQVMLGVPNIRAASRSRYAVTVSFDRKGDRAASAAIADPPLSAAPGWYRGDLHMHDANSDGSCVSRSGERVPCPLFRTVEAAAAAGLDFIAVTDHNTTAHFDGLRELQPYFDKILLIPGVEVTTFKGHANVLGASGFVDFRIGTPGVANLGGLQDRVAASGAILSLNHPAAPTGEDCMGCGWVWPDTDYDKIVAIEVVNGPIAEGRYGGLEFWYARLNEGHRLTGIAGSDNHDPDAPGGKPPIGRPATVVHAAALSRDGILDGIRGGNVFIDVEGTQDRLLEVDAAADTQRAPTGGRLAAKGPLDVRAHVAGASGSTASLVVDGGIVASRPIASADETIVFRAPAARRWLSVNVRGANGQLLLIGNPIYIDAVRQSMPQAAKRP